MILVIGDIILDTFVKGEYEKIGAEAMPVIRLNEISHQLGGAANVAHNIKSMGEEVILIGATGNDWEGDTIISLLDEKKIMHFIDKTMIRTAHKTRINQLVRIDNEEIQQINLEIPKNLNPDFIVISDYAKGAITQKLCDDLLKRFTCPILVDPKQPLDYPAWLITPNLKDAEKMTGKEGTGDCMKHLEKKYPRVLLTLGKRGMIFKEGEELLDIPTQAKEVYDVTGAGDVVIAVIASELRKGKSLIEAIRSANRAAGIAVGHYGQYIVKGEDL